MIVVLIAFGVTGPIPPTEVGGIALALAVLLNATVVRMMLVPSLMKLPTQLVEPNVARQAPSSRPLLPLNVSSRPMTTPLSPLSGTAVLHSSFHELLGFVGPQDDARKADADQPFWGGDGCGAEGIVH